MKTIASFFLIIALFTISSQSRGESCDPRPHFEWVKDDGYRAKGANRQRALQQIVENFTHCLAQEKTLQFKPCDFVSLQSQNINSAIDAAAWLLSTQPLGVDQKEKIKRSAEGYINFLVGETVACFTKEALAPILGKYSTAVHVQDLESFFYTVSRQPERIGLDSVLPENSFRSKSVCVSYCRDPDHSYIFGLNDLFIIHDERSNESCLVDKAEAERQISSGTWTCVR